MEINFKDITYSNIMSVGASPITVQLNACTKTLITGTNGAGKSTMIEALCFLLYGKPFRNIKKAQLINAINKKGLLVEGNLSVGKNDFYIKRGIKPDLLEIHKNGEQIPEMASITEFQQYFESDLLGISLESFKQIIVLGTAGYTPFMELSVPKRRDLVEDLLDVAVLGVMDSLNKIESKNINSNISAIELSVDSKERETVTIQRGIDAQRAQTDALVSTQVAQVRELVGGVKSTLEDIKTLEESILKIEQSKPSKLDVDDAITKLSKSYDKSIFEEKINSVVVPSDSDLELKLSFLEQPVSECEYKRLIDDVESQFKIHTQEYDDAISNVPVLRNEPENVPPFEPESIDGLNTTEFDEIIQDANFVIKDCVSKIKFHNDGGECPTCGGSADASGSDVQNFIKLSNDAETRRSAAITLKDDATYLYNQDISFERKRYAEYVESEKSYNQEMREFNADSINQSNLISAINQKYNKQTDDYRAELLSIDNNTKQIAEKYDNMVAFTKREHIALVNEANTLINSYKNEMDSASTKLASLVNTLQNDYNVSLQEHTASIVRINDKIAAQKQQVTLNVDRAKEIKAIVDKLNETVYDTSELDAITKQISELKLQKSELFEEKYCRGIISTMLKDSGIKASIIKKYIPIFNKKINEYLGKLNADYSFHLNESFEETIKSRGRESFAYASFSEGEKTRINSALLFTWRDIASLVSGVNINLLILDEVADGSSDAAGVEALNSILDKMNSNIFVISHRIENVNESFQRHIQMKKQGRFTVCD